MSYSADYSYCVAHDRYFKNDKERDQHVQESLDHPQCHICDRRFLNLHTLRKVKAPVVCQKLKREANQRNLISTLSSRLATTTAKNAEDILNPPKGSNTTSIGSIVSPMTTLTMKMIIHPTARVPKTTPTMTGRTNVVLKRTQMVSPPRDWPTNEVPMTITLGKHGTAMTMKTKRISKILLKWRMNNRTRKKKKKKKILPATSSAQCARRENVERFARLAVDTCFVRLVSLLR